MIANTVNMLVYSVMTRPDVKIFRRSQRKVLGVTRLGGGNRLRGRAANQEVGVST